MIHLASEHRALIEQRQEAMGIKNKTALARLLGISSPLISRLLHAQAPQASPETLELVIERMGLSELSGLLPQLDLFEITPEFIDAAQTALRHELEALKREVGPLPVAKITGFVGLQFHGRTPSRRAIERRFPVKVIRKA